MERVNYFSKMNVNLLFAVELDLIFTYIHLNVLSRGFFWHAEDELNLVLPTISCYMFDFTVGYVLIGLNHAYFLGLIS